eukprot:CAMPEP_0183832142 /NCGR_PEP_ID=MMETSP0807_2-20130328/5188_1 /TAXON_ID=88271 /ORGANISM="Picocystis salinarum, Strain CCMP1897" /LENGTH=254 /DNA_ID=CAMNT_0026077771 /DNA_START=101 /DNA_END=865 /DNA_ORIENTATION=-
MAWRVLQHVSKVRGSIRPLVGWIEARGVRGGAPAQVWCTWWGVGEDVEAVVGKRALPASGVSHTRGFAAGTLPPHEVLPMPALSPTMVEGTVSAWKKQEGDAVNTGDVLADIETDKATMEMETMEDGFLAKILAPAGSANVAVGTPVAILVTSEEDIPAFKDYQAEGIEAKSSPTPSNASSPKPDKTPEPSTKAPAAADESAEKAEPVQVGRSSPPATPMAEPAFGSDGPRVYISDASVLQGPPGWVPGRRAVQ